MTTNAIKRSLTETSLRRWEGKAMSKETHDGHVQIRNGNFPLFGQLWRCGDFGSRGLGEFAKRLELNALQKELFSEWIEKIEAKIWFWSADKNDCRKESPGLEINVFWDTFDSHVSGANLLEMLDEPFFEMRNQIGHEEEIAALEKLKAMVDRAIELRREWMKEDAT